MGKHAKGSFQRFHEKNAGKLVQLNAIQTIKEGRNKSMGNSMVNNKILLIIILNSIIPGLATATDFPQFPKSVKLVDSKTLPIEAIKEECESINVKDNVSRCITNTMNHWASYRRALKEHPKASELCYNNLKEIDDYILINNCIAAATE